MKNEINIVQTSESFMYLNKRKAIGYELAEDWILSWTIFMPIALILNIFSKESILIYKGLIFIILVFGVTLIRRYIKGAFKYILANAFIIFLAFISSSTFLEKVVLITPIIFCIIVSMKKRNSEVMEFYKISILLWCEILLVVCYFIAFNYKLTFMIKLINFASINIAITCALYVCMSRLSKLLEWEGKFIKEYSKRMKTIKISCITFISGVILFFVFVVFKIGIYELFDKLTINILSFFNRTQSDKVQLVEVKPPIKSDLSSLYDSMKDIQTPGKSNYLLNNILKVVQVFIIAALALLIIYLLFRLIIKIKDFYKGLNLKNPYKKEERESVISLEDVIKEIKNKAEKFKVKLNLPFNTSNRSKIRKLYHKLIKSYNTTEMSTYKFNTPMEIESEIRRDLEKNIYEATIIYEKARYGDAESSKEEVEKMKSFLNL